MLNWRGFQTYGYIVASWTLIKLGAFIYPYECKAWLVLGGKTDKKGMS